MANNSSLASCAENVTNGNVTCDEAKDEESWQARGVLIMEQYMFVILFIIGWINNCLSILVLQTKAYRGTSTGFLMTVLACADIGVVSTSAAQIWIRSLVGYDIRLYTSMACKWHVLFTYLFVHLSAWSLTLITIERVVCVFKPLRVREIFSLRKTIMAWVVIVCLLFGMNLHFLWTMEAHYVESYDMLVCDAPQELVDKGLWTIWSPIDLVLASAAPFAIILPCNVLIVVAITRRAIWRRNSSSTGEQISSTTVMLTINSVAFVLLTAPAAIELAWLAYGTLDPSDPTVNFLLFFFHLLFNLNSCLNFVLYSASSSKFRRALRNLWCTPSTDSSSSRSNSTIQSTYTDVTKDARRTTSTDTTKDTRRSTSTDASKDARRTTTTDVIKKTGAHTRRTNSIGVTKATGGYSREINSTIVTKTIVSHAENVPNGSECGIELQTIKPICL